MGGDGAGMSWERVACSCRLLSGLLSRAESANAVRANSASSVHKLAHLVATGPFCAN
jgi:hypothetical protein